MQTKPRLMGIALAAAGALTAQGAAAVPLPADGQWAIFDVAFDLSGNLNWIDLNDATDLSFDFVVPAGSFGSLTVVDAGFAGDRFEVSSIVGSVRNVLGLTSLSVNSYPDSIGLNFDAALADPAYSRGSFVLASGSYSITGLLSTSSVDNLGNALDSTVGGIRLTISPVPEPATALSMLAGLSLLVVALRRRYN